MQLTVENLNSTQRLLKVTLPADQIRKMYDAEVHRNMKSARLPGFRKGHVPVNVVESRYGEQIMGQLLSQCVQDSLQDAQKQNGIHIVGKPQVSFGNTSIRDGHDITYDITVDVYPELELHPLQDLSVREVTSHITAADIDAMIERIRDQRARWQVDDTLAAAADLLVYLDIRTVRDTDRGEDGSGGRTTNEFPLIIGRNSPYPGFDEKIIGHHAGDRFSFSLEYAPDTTPEVLAGHSFDFEVSIKSVSRKILPEVDEQLIRAMGVRDGTMESFRREVERNLQRTMSDELHRTNFRHVTDALLKEYGEFELPQSLIEREHEALIETFARRMAQYQHGRDRRRLDLDKLVDDVARDRLREIAVRRARFEVIMFNITRSKEFTGPTQEQINDECRLQAAAYENADAAAAEIRNDRVLYQGVIEAATEKAFVSYVLGHATATQEDMSFSSLLSAGREGEAQ